MKRNIEQIIIDSVNALLDNYDIQDLGWSASMPSTYNNPDYPIYSIKGILACTNEYKLFLFPSSVNRDNVYKVDETYCIDIDETIDNLLLSLEVNY